MTSHGDGPTIVAIGDSAMWGTGTAYRFKPPNLVHKMLNDGEPIPPVQFRARGGAFIGRSNSCGLPLTDANGTFDETYAAPDEPAISRADCAVDNPTLRPGMDGADFTASDTGDDDYGYEANRDDWDFLNLEARQNPDLDPKNIDTVKWSIRRDLGRPFPTHLQQIDQFADWSSSRTLDVPWGGNRPVNFYRDRTYPDPFDPVTDSPGDGKPFSRTPATTPPKPEDVDMVLLNGGTNDIGLFYMMNFLNDYNDLMRYTEQFCYRDNKYMLKKARERFPNALLVLLGYPIFLSEWTDYTSGREFLREFQLFKSFGATSATLAGSLGGTRAIESVVDGGTVFSRSHNHYMRKAAAERDHVDVRNGDPGVMYVARGFGAVNAYQAPDTFAWNGDDDDTYERRKHFVVSLIEEPNAPKKLRASIGHPNRRGSIQTARAIVERYRQRQSLSTAEHLDSLDDSTTSLRDSMRPHGLFPNSFGQSGTGSVSHALTHRVVDSLQVRFYRRPVIVTPGQRKVKDKPWLAEDVDLYLDIEPGRNGSGGESFRLDYESDTGRTGIQPISNRRNTPQFDEDSGEAPIDRDGDPNNKTVVTEVNVDPMMGQHMTGTVQTNLGDDRTSKEDNADPGFSGSPYQGSEISWDKTDLGPENDIPNDASAYFDRWDTNRLRLNQIQRARLRVEGSSTWALNRIEFTINGELTRTTRRTEGMTLQEKFADAAKKNLGGFWIQLFP